MVRNTSAEGLIRYLTTENERIVCSFKKHAQDDKILKSLKTITASDFTYKTKKCGRVLTESREALPLDFF